VSQLPVVFLQREMLGLPGFAQRIVMPSLTLRVSVIFVDNFARNTNPKRESVSEGFQWAKPVYRVAGAEALRGPAAASNLGARGTPQIPKPNGVE
jgi:hypothetical protein